MVEVGGNRNVTNTWSSPAGTRTAEGWVLLENLRAFLFFLADSAGYGFLPEELDAIRIGVEESDAEAGKWYDFEFDGSRTRITFYLARDPGTSVMHFRVRSTDDALARIEVAASLMSEYRLHGTRA